MARRLGAHADGQSAGRRRPLPLAIAHFRKPVAAAGSSTSPAAPPIAAIRPALALCRVQVGDGRHDQDHRPRLCRGRHPRLRGRPGFTMSEMIEEYLAGRGGAAIVAEIPLGRVASADRSRRDDPLARNRRAGRLDRLGDRRQRRQLCSLGRLPGACRNGAPAPADHHPARQDAAADRAPEGADRGIGTAMGRGMRRVRPIGTSPRRRSGSTPTPIWSAPAAFPRSCDRQRGPCADRRRDGEGRGARRRQYPRSSASGSGT